MELFRQIEELYARFVDTDQIRLVKEAVDFVETKTFSVPRESAKKANATIYGAYASGVNVYLSSHWDKNFTYCAISIHQRKPYLESQNVVAYFAFPQLGIAIPLCPVLQSQGATLHIILLQQQEGHLLCVFVS